jgi:hypothetical protein
VKHFYAYRVIALPANLVTIICSFVAWGNSSVTELSLLFWMKLITTLLLIAYIHLFQQNLVFFFMNIGFGRIRFYSVMLIADLLVFSLLTTLVAAIS